MKFMISLFFTGLFIFGVSGRALEESSVQGLWVFPKDGTLVQIKVKDGIAEGKILRRPGNRQDEIDRHNPQPSLRDRSIVGLVVLSDLKNSSPREWKGGSVYDPDSGSTYHVRAFLKDTDTLNLRGYLGIPLFGRTAILKRYRDY